MISLTSTPQSASLLWMLGPTIIVLLGAGDDLLSKKFHNKLFISCSIGAVVFQYLLGGFEYVGHGGLGMLAALSVMLPLSLLKIVGAGDLKLMMAIGLASHWHIGLFLPVHALFWGAILGVVRVLLSREAYQFAQNIKFLILHKTTTGLTLHKIPFAVAIAFGWLSYLKYEGHI